MDHTVLIFQDTEPDVLARVLHALEPLPAEAAGVREGVRVLHLVLPVSRAGAEPAQIVKGSFTEYIDIRVAFIYDDQTRGGSITQNQ